MQLNVTVCVLESKKTDCESTRGRRGVGHLYKCYWCVCMYVCVYMCGRGRGEFYFPGEKKCPGEVTEE